MGVWGLTKMVDPHFFLKGVGGLEKLDTLDPLGRIYEPSF